MNIPPGGSANINGILYQMLWSLLEAFALQIKDCDSDPTGRTASQAFLVLEPRGGGGDLLVSDSDVEVVQQLKARSDGGAWSLREIVSDVLPDLYRAVKLDRAQRFVFVTEGRMGEWEEAHGFFNRLGRRPVPESGQDVLGGIDDARGIKFRGALRPGGAVSALSERALFEEIVALLREKEPAGSEEGGLTHRKLWKLLAGLEFRWGQTATQLHAHLRQRLRAVVDNADLLDQTLDALVTALAREASRGNARIQAEPFLQAQKLPALPLTNWHRLVDHGSTALEERLPLFRYRPAEDVRASLESDTLQPWLCGESPFLVLSGGSGQGKTWRLVRLARTLAWTVPTVLLEATGNGQRDLDGAASLFWQGIANHDGTLAMDRIARRVREAVPLQAGYWLAVFVDDVRTTMEAEELYRLFRPIEGIRLAFTAPPEVAERFAEAFERDVLIAPVSDFTDAELRQYVAGGDAQAWHDIPPDIRAVIRRPLLADLYRQISSGGEPAPNTEYKLYARYYRLRLVNPLRERFPTAFAGIKKAALAVWHGASYPWSLEQFQDFGLLDPQLVRFLLEIGWLLRDERQDYQVWHDRLLNWQVAEMLADAIERGQEDAAAFGKRCASDFHRVPAKDKARPLGYVFMDVIWLLAQRGAPTADALDAVLQQMEEDFRTVQTVYESLLPTVGAAIVPALFRRLEAAKSGQIHAGHLVNALGTLDREAVAPRAARLLYSGDAALRRNGMGILAKRPSADALETLWLRYTDLLKERGADRTEQEKESWREALWERLSLWPALEACVPLDPAWLERKIRVKPAATGVLVGALASLLGVLPDGRSYWLRLKGTLRQSVAGGGEREFANAAYRWRDDGEVEWLREHAPSQETGVGASCLRALVRIAPDSALEALGALPPEDLSATRAWTTDLLWACRPGRTAVRVRELMRERPDALWDLAEIFYDLPDAVDEDMLGLLLDGLFDKMAEGTAEELRSELRRVGSVSRLPLLRCLQRRAGTAWEDRLTRLLVEGDPLPTGWRDARQEDAVKALYKTGGAGFTRLVNHWLANGDLHARREGIDVAFKRPDAVTIQLLGALATQGNDGERADGSDYDSRVAQLALARCGAWHSVIQTIVLWQGDSNREMVFAHWGAEPLSDADMEPALAALKEDPKHPGAIMALGFGQRTDHLPRIVARLAEENPEEYTPIVNACVWAMTLLPRTQPEAVEVLAQRLSRPEGRWLIIPLLIRDGSDRAAEKLLEFLRRELDAPLPSPYSTAIADDAVAAARFLLQNPDARDEVAMLCRRRIAGGTEPDFIAQRLIQMLLDEEDEQETDGAHSILGLLADERTRDLLMRNAFQEDGGIRFVGEKARTIRGLSAFSPADAYAAALRVLKSPKAGDRDRAPHLLLEIDRARAVGDLLDHLTTERRTHLRRTCARALCAAGTADELREQYLTSLTPEHREAACFVLGFAPPAAETDAAVRARLDDEDVRVFEAACGALCRLSAARHTEELVIAYLSDQDPSRRWVLLDAALEVGDVFDVSWLRRMIRDAPPLVMDYVQEQVKKRREEDQRKAESVDWHNHVE